MTTSKTILKRAFCLLFIAAASLSLIHAQEAKKSDESNEKAAKVKELIESKNFVFVAQSVTPLRGGMRQLTSEYDMKVSPDAIESYLPYFGRAYTAPISPSDAGIQFTSKNYEYTVKESKKRGWDVLIKPKDTKDVRQLLLSISKNGYATLQVVSNSKQPISYNGYITEPKQKENK